MTTKPTDPPSHPAPPKSIKEIYRASLKPNDIAFNLYFARPAAALLISVLLKTPITPNQLTFFGLVIFALGPLSFFLWPTTLGFVLATIIIEFAYIIDQADGQLARLTQRTSELGAQLDFLIDEFKALLLVAGIGLGLWNRFGADHWLILGLLGALVIAFATSLTGFIRRPEYAGVAIRPGTQVTGPPRPKGAIAYALWLSFKLLKLIAHYPAWILPLALLGFLPIVDSPALFLVLYIGVHILYLGKTTLAVLLRLGRSSFYASADNGDEG